MTNDSDGRVRVIPAGNTGFHCRVAYRGEGGEKKRGAKLTNNSKFLIHGTFHRQDVLEDLIARGACLKITDGSRRGKFRFSMADAAVASRRGIHLVISVRTTFLEVISP